MYAYSTLDLQFLYQSEGPHTKPIYMHGLEKAVVAWNSSWTYNFPVQFLNHCGFTNPSLGGAQGTKSHIWRSEAGKDKSLGG